MSPSIVVVDATDGARRGRLLSRHALAPEHRRISSRHLAVDDAPPLAGWLPLAGRHGRLPADDRVQRVAPLARDAVAWDNHLTAVA